MNINEALSIIDRIITTYLLDYEEADDNYKDVKDADGVITRALIKIPLHYVDETDKLFALDVAQKEVSLKTIPMTLLEANGSTATELKRVNKDYFVRVPSYPEKDKEMDIDAGLAYAVIFLSLGNLYNKFSDYTQKGDFIINSYNLAYKQTLKEILSGTSTSSDVSYIRFSADGANWHTSFMDGDIYISFRRVDTESWTTSIKFVGDNGVDGKPCSDTNLISLQDTPKSYVDMAGKVLAVNSDATALEFIDAPSGGSSVFNDTLDGDIEATGTISLNLYDNAVSCRWYYELTGDTTLVFNENADAIQGAAGRIYTFHIVPNGYNFAWDSNISWNGDASIANNTPQILTAYYDGIEWYVLNKLSF